MVCPGELVQASLLNCLFCLSCLYLYGAQVYLGTKYLAALLCVRYLGLGALIGGFGIVGNIDTPVVGVRNDGSVAVEAYGARSYLHHMLGIVQLNHKTDIVG